MRGGLFSGGAFKDNSIGENVCSGDAFKDQSFGDPVAISWRPDLFLSLDDNEFPSHF